MLCKIAAFYSGYKIEDLADVPKRTLDIMWECITIIEAQDQLKMMNALDWPNMKKNQRQKLHRDLFKQAYPSSVKQKTVVDAEAFQRMFGG